MAAATVYRFRIADKGLPQVRKAAATGAAGWIGSKAGARNDVVVVDSNGYYDQATTAGAAVSGSPKIGFLQSDVASTVAAASDDALAVEARVPTETTIITAPLVNNSDTFTTVLATRVGELFGFWRHTTYGPCFDDNATDMAECIGVDVANGLLRCKILPAARLA